MTITFRIARTLLDVVHADLARPHEIAAERVGFLHCRVAELRNDGLLVLARTYHPVDDADYLDDRRVGAMLDANAFRKPMKVAYAEKISVFHVHCHEHRGLPWFGPIDLSENASFVPDFFHVRPEFPHGALVLSRDALSGLCWIPKATQPRRIDKLAVVGA